jgi:putative transposase
MSTIQRAYKTELALNNKQVTACKKHAGAARWAYNWGLQRKQEVYRATGTSPSAIDLHRELNALKKSDLSWMYEVSKCAPQEALRNLDRAFDHFFRRAKLAKAGKHLGKLGYPQRKSKKRGLGSFRLTGTIVVFPDAVQLPRLGRLRLKERGYLPTTGTLRIKILSATISDTISEQAGHWYVSVLVEQQQVVPQNTGPVVGVDLGLKRLATLSSGEVEQNPWHLKTAPAEDQAVAPRCRSQSEGEPEPQESCAAARHCISEGGESASGRVASIHESVGENQVSRGD